MVLHLIQMCNQMPSGSRNKFNDFFRWSRLDKKFWWIPANQKKEFCGESVQLGCMFLSKKRLRDHAN